MVYTSYGDAGPYELIFYVLLVSLSVLMGFKIHDCYEVFGSNLLGS